MGLTGDQKYVIWNGETRLVVSMETVSRLFESYGGHRRTIQYPAQLELLRQDGTTEFVEATGPVEFLASRPDQG